MRSNFWPLPPCATSDTRAVSSSMTSFAASTASAPATTPKRSERPSAVAGRDGRPRS